MIKMNAFVMILLVAFMLPLFCSCGNPGKTSPEVKEVLELAGKNAPELEKAIQHYEQTGDSLKLQALYYLIGNMKHRSYRVYDLRDKDGNVIDFNVLDYPDLYTMSAALDSIVQEHGIDDFTNSQEVFDYQSISSEFLINQIDYAFRAWREKPWAEGLPFEDFCEYILPYRGSNEPLEPWREYFWNKYAGIESQMTNPTDPLEAASLINDDIKTWFHFDPRYYEHPTDQGFTEMVDGGLGRCEDMTNLTIFAMRANGLAVTADFTPWWANTGNNHAWNAIVTPDGRVVPFMGAEANPGKYRLANKLAKVYRKMFSKQENSLAFQDRKQQEMPKYISSTNLIDVTADYVEVCDVTIPLPYDVSDSASIGYLCVFNSGEWRPIHWGFIESGQVTFTDMGMDIAYLPALYIDGEVVPFSSPFILRTDSSMEPLEAEDDQTITVKLTSTTHRKLVVSTDGIDHSAIRPGTDYKLFYWKDGWISLGSAVAGEGPLQFDNVPAGGLYWLLEKDSSKEERIFTIQEGKQVWW